MSVEALPIKHTVLCFLIFYIIRHELIMCITTLNHIQDQYIPVQLLGWATSSNRDCFLGGT